MEIESFAYLLGIGVELAGVLVMAGVALGISISNMFRIRKLERKEDK